MKKILIATTALVATAGMAAADIQLNGSARFGVVYKDAKGSATKATTGLNTRYNLDIVGSTETDSGITFGTKIRIRSDGSETAQPASAPNGAEFTMASSGLKLALGNTSGAIDSMSNLYANEIGLTTFVGMYSGHGLSYQGYNSIGADITPGVSVKYAVGDFGVMASSHKAGTETYNALNASYTFSGWTVALGVQDVSDSVAANKAAADAKDLTALSVGGTVGSFGVTGLITNTKAGTGIGLGASYEISAATKINAVVSSYDPSASGAKNTTAYGIGVSHDLGGATLKAGIGQDAAETTIADLGVSFSF